MIYILYIGVYLLYTAVSISAMQQCKSAICMYVYVYMHKYNISLELPTPLGHHRLLNGAPCTV